MPPQVQVAPQAPTLMHNFYDHAHWEKVFAPLRTFQKGGASQARWVVFRGESIAWLKLLPSKSVNAMFLDPPYFLSNGGTTFHSNQRVAVHKGDWDVSQGPELDHQFYMDVLRECQRILTDDGSLFVSGTRHCIGSIEFAMQKLGFHILNDIIWRKTTAPANVGCRQLNDVHETILWASPRKGPGGRLLHKFHYDKITQLNQIPICTKSKCGKVGDLGDDYCAGCGNKFTKFKATQVKSVLKHGVPEKREKWFMAEAAKWIADDGLYWYNQKDRDGNPKTASSYPAQKPVGLVRFLLSMVTDPGDIVLDPFMGSCATGVAAGHLDCHFVGNDGNETAYNLSAHRLTHWREHEGILVPMQALPA